MITACCWKWGSLFSPEYVNRLRAALERHLRVPHELVCVTDDAQGIDRRVRIVDIPETYSNTPRCRRRMQVFSRDFAAQIGPRILSIDLDVVIVDDITPLVTRNQPAMFWRVGYAQVYSGSFHLMEAGLLDGLWQRFAADPVGFPRLVQEKGTPSDQAMLNWYLNDGMPVAEWTESDGFVSYFGAGYERFEHLGVGPSNPKLPNGARIVVLGSADKAVMDEGRYAWVRKHWTSLPGEAA